MAIWLKRTLVAAAALVALSAGTASTVQAQDPYWDNYWTWYDGQYRPYYQSYYATPYDPVTGQPAAVAPQRGPVYSTQSYYAPGGAYYSGPFIGVRSGPAGGGVRLGPLRFGWR